MHGIQIWQLICQCDQQYYQAMSIDCHLHLTGQSLKCLLYDCFAQPRQNIIVNDGYLVRFQNQHSANIYSFDHTFTQYTHVVGPVIQNAKIPSFSQLQCLRFQNMEDQTLIIYTVKQSIFIQTINKERGSKTIESVKANLSKNEDFLYFSQLVKMVHYQLFVAYTSMNQFYLVLIKEDKKMQVVKVKNKQYCLGFLLWFTQPFQIEIPNNIYLHIYRIDERDHFILLLSVKDNIVSLYLISVYPQTNDSQIKLIGTCQSVKKVIPSSAIMKQVLIVPRDSFPNTLQCIISYQLKQGYILILLLCVNYHKQHLFEVSVILEDIPSLSFSMAYYHSHLLYTIFSEQEKAYQIFKKKVHAQQKKHSQGQQIELFLVSKYKPYFMQVNQRLFITSCCQSYSVHAENISSSSSQLSQMQQQIAEFKNQINHLYKKQIGKQLKKVPVSIQQVVYLLTQKSRKVIDWIKKQFNQFLPNEQHTYLILTLEIIITLSIKNLLTVTSLQNIHKLYSAKKAEITMKEIYQVISNCQISSVIHLLNHLAQIEPKIVNQILDKLQEQKQVRYGCGEAIKTIFSESYEIIVAKMQDRLLQDKQCVDIMAKVIGFDLSSPKTYSRLLQRDQKIFKDLILQTQSISLFIEYFEHMQLKQEEIKQFCGKVHNVRRQSLYRIIGQVILKFKRSLKNQMLKYQQITLILQGFSDYPDQLVCSIKKHFPPLLLFYYLKTGNRKEGIQFIQQLADKTSNQCSQILNLIIADIEQEQMAFAKDESKLQSILNIGDGSQSDKSESRKKMKRE